MNEPNTFEVDDFSLLQRIKSGDEDALNYVIQQHKNKNSLNVALSLLAKR